MTTVSRLGSALRHWLVPATEPDPDWIVGRMEYDEDSPDDTGGPDQPPTTLVPARRR